MKNTILLMALISMNVRASEHDLQALMCRNNQQTLAFILVMSSIGAHELLKNVNTFCQANAPVCWQVALPLTSLSVAGIYLLSKKINL
ncbi:MAG: hypothetical protein AMXMBFR12_08030 [Candidatus Babeliales bacterium]